MDNQEKNINITSFFQQGGITANQVFIGKQPRQLDDRLKGNLKSMIAQDKSKKIEVNAVMGDPEAFQYANEIKNYLISQGYTAVDGVAQAIFSQPVTGNQITPMDETLCRITIGTNL